MKMQLVESRNLGGAMMWSIETDDFRGLCGESYPLLKTMNRAMGKDVSGGGGNGGGSVTPAPTPAPTPGGNGGGSGGNGGGSSEDCSVNGHFLHSSDCNKYYQCADGIRYDFQCGEGLYFDVNTFTCNWTWEVNCPY